MMRRPAAHISRKRLRSGHPWVFSNEVKQVDGNPGVGDSVDVFEHGTYVGSGSYNPHSLIRIRVYSERQEEMDAAFFKRRLIAAKARREGSLPDERDYRLLYGESDGVPGLVVDRYGDCYAVQAYSAAVDRRLSAIIQALNETCQPSVVYEKNDFRLRDIEGLPRREGPLLGEAPPAVEITEGGVRFLVDIRSGQKTGYYFDHRLTRRRVRTLSSGHSVLDVFCYTGSFAVNAALGGSSRVLGVDASADACRRAAANAILNGVEDVCEFVFGDAFEFLEKLERDGNRFDVVNVDPPAFIKSRRERSQGLHGYRRVNALAMRLLADGGTLVSSSCSHHLSWQDLQDVLTASSRDVVRRFAVLDRTVQSPDHPILLSMPETEYLRGFILQAS